MRTYTTEDDPPRITCHVCRRTSCNTTDVEKRYCACCGWFHDDMERILPAILPRLRTRLQQEDEAAAAEPPHSTGEGG